MKKLVFVLTLIFLTGTAAGFTSAELENFKKSYNNQSSKVPSVVGSIVGGEKVNVHINGSDGTEVIGADMEGVEIEALQNGGFTNQTMNVYSDEETVETVLNSDDSFNQVKKELNSNDITYNSTTTGGQIKLTVFESLNDLANLIGISF